MNKPVSFELAKLLKEKGFDEECDYLVYEGNKYQYLKGEKYRNTFLSIKGEDIVIPNEKDWEKQIKENPEKFDRKKWGIKITAPTIAEVIMWLYEKHGIWIELTMGKDHTGVWFDWDIFSTITPRKDDLLGEEDVEYKDNPNEKWLNYDTTYSSMIDERFTTMDKESCSSPTKAYEAAIEYTLKNLI